MPQVILMDWPDWWNWELAISYHCIKRMQDRNFNEADLRAMFDDATKVVEQVQGTFVVETRHDEQTWEVVVCPDPRNQRIVVVTAYRSE